MGKASVGTLQKQVRGLQRRLDSVQERTDGWQNLLTGFGVLNKDKRMSTQFAGTARLTQATLTSMFTDDGFAQRVVSLPADDMVREWFKVEGDTDGLILQSLKELRAKYHINRALKWARLYGGSLIVKGIDDGGKFEVPLNENGIKKVSFLRSYDRWKASVISYYNDPTTELYGQPELYMISPLQGSPYNVHASRVMIFDGVDVPDDIRRLNNDWGDSVLQAVYERVRGLGEAYGNIETIISEFIIGMLTVKNLAELLASGQEGLVQNRLNQIDLSKHVINSILLDEGEKFERISATTTGLEKLIEKLTQAVSSVTGIPITLLMGESPAGLQATGASDIRFYYDSISADQETILQPQLEDLICNIMLSSEGPTRGKEIDGWQIVFNPLWQPTEKEQAETRKMVAETDAIYLDRSVLMPEEVANSRFGGNQYSVDTTLLAERGTPTLEAAGEGEDMTGEQGAGGADETATE